MLWLSLRSWRGREACLAEEEATRQLGGRSSWAAGLLRRVIIGSYYFRFGLLHVYLIVVLFMNMMVSGRGCLFTFPVEPSTGSGLQRLVLIVTNLIGTGGDTEPASNKPLIVSCKRQKGSAN